MTKADAITFIGLVLLWTGIALQVGTTVRIWRTLRGLPTWDRRPAGRGNREDIRS